MSNGCYASALSARVSREHWLVTSGTFLGCDTATRTPRPGIATGTAADPHSANPTSGSEFHLTHVPCSAHLALPGKRPRAPRGRSRVPRRAAKTLLPLTPERPTSCWQHRPQATTIERPPVCGPSVLSSSPPPESHCHTGQGHVCTNPASREETPRSEAPYGPPSTYTVLQSEGTSPDGAAPLRPASSHHHLRPSCCLVGDSRHGSRGGACPQESSGRPSPPPRARDTLPPRRSLPCTRPPAGRSPPPRPGFPAGTPPPRCPSAPACSRSAGEHTETQSALPPGPGRDRPEFWLRAPGPSRLQNRQPQGLHRGSFGF